MRSPLIQRRRGNTFPRSRERGVTMALVAASIAVVIAMAALSIDVGTLYEASAEAQRSADAAALAAARVLSISGMTGDPTNSSGDWSKACAAALQAAQSVAGQNYVGGVAPGTPTVTFSSTDGTNCNSTGGAFGVNPQVTVKVANTSLPIFFARIFGLFNSNWSAAGVSATATAEAYNPSNSTTVGGDTMVTVQPRCVKPLIIPNADPLNPSTCRGRTCQPFVNPATGTVENGGILVTGSSTTGVIGETFNLFADCSNNGSSCTLVTPRPHANPMGVPNQPSIPNLQYVPGQILGTPVGAPACASGLYQQAIAGCDQSTPYQCGVQAGTLGSSANQVDLSENPLHTQDAAEGVECLTGESGAGLGNGQDTLVQTSFPYQIQAGTANPTGITGYVTSSNSIVTLPIYDGGRLTLNGNLAPVTIVGFLQVFINGVNADNENSLSVTVLNVAGCGNTATTGVGGTPFVTGTSPVPIRLITPP
jgi:Flp pilus assembly protein TadG